MFENKQYKGIYYTRFIASWQHEDGNVFDSKFEHWLRQLVFDEGEHMPDIVVHDIVELARNGKLELQKNAQYYLSKVED